jgi:hypothetical protein
MRATHQLQSLIAIILLSGCGREDSSDDQGPGIAGGNAAVQEDSASSQDGGEDSRSATPDRAASDRQRILEEFIQQWNALTKSAEGAGLLERQRGLAMAIVGDMGGSAELLAFLDFLQAQGAGDLRQEIIDTAASTIFSGTGAKENREWLLTLEDLKLKEHLSRQAGEAFSGVGFKQFFDRMGGKENHHSQAALLTGYCVTLAKNDPEAAVKVYRELSLPYRIDFTGMRHLMAAFPPETDFLKIAVNEIGVDDKTLAKANRAALLDNWAGQRPREAAQYVIANSTKVHADQMAVVMRRWAQVDPAEAAAWLDTAPPGKAHDEGRLALSRHLLEAAEAPAAWAQAAKIGNFDARVAAATEVFEKWAIIDRDAATRAWVELFPGEAQGR